MPDQRHLKFVPRIFRIGLAVSWDPALPSGRGHAGHQRRPLRPVLARRLQHNRTEMGRLKPPTYEQTVVIPCVGSDLERAAAHDLFEAAIRVATKGSTCTTEQPRAPSPP